MSAPMETFIVRRLKPLLHEMEAKVPYNLQKSKRAWSMPSIPSIVRGY